MRALVVDDSYTMRIYLAHILERLGLEVDAAPDGTGALQKLEAGPLPDVILLDWNMPGLSGLEVLESIRYQPAWAGLKVMMVTSETEQAMVGNAIRCGANEYLMKPFTLDAVAEKLALLGVTAGLTV